MQPFPVPVLPVSARIRSRSALVASADRSFRQRVSETLTGLRWQVREAEGGAEAWAEAETLAPEAVIVDSWLPDLDLAEFLKDFRSTFPQVDLITAGSASTEESPRGPYRQELLYALRRSQDSDGAAWNMAPMLNRPSPAPGRPQTVDIPIPLPILGSAIPAAMLPLEVASTTHNVPRAVPIRADLPVIPPVAIPLRIVEPASSGRLPELVGNAACMLEVSRRVRLVAPRSTPVLIEGPTGSGKELVAEALHRLSLRSRNSSAVQAEKGMIASALEIAKS
jgi:CheY-like chemotaxis protein